ncbi:hypothetical protein LEP1GSC008_2192 [Leptospira kirschneri serovar Bulgarica str. Nikolaevo]|uniref:Uncharacterized protein n=1 Tax=Leptospira kirschneri serovar Bulgarica str. Nikolaevo TaxID=1240687 RepID=M6F2F8_9LEPT|nr:hypothetical protein LEP1GSC008_2192 [Leptospira kirschneri serovar Bulgarica str. Nikolaevo]
MFFIRKILFRKTSYSRKTPFKSLFQTSFYKIEYYTFLKDFYSELNNKTTNQ